VLVLVLVIVIEKGRAEGSITSTIKSKRRWISEVNSSPGVTKRSSEPLRMSGITGSFGDYLSSTGSLLPLGRCDAWSPLYRFAQNYAVLVSEFVPKS
jgi:hypothetical protein